MGGKGLFVKEIEDALLARDAEIAVHSMKDLPAVLRRRAGGGGGARARGPARRALLAAAQTLDPLPKGAKVGTSSLRRAAQLKALRPDLQIEMVRGNVETRLRKASEGLDAVVLAYAGLRRLGLAEHATQVFSPEEMLPAVAQGALALEARADDRATLARLAPLDDAETRQPGRGRARAPAPARGRLPGAHRGPCHGRGRPRLLRALVASLDGARDRAR